MPLSLKSINAELSKLGVRLEKGTRYFYFRGGESSNWLDKTVSALAASAAVRLVDRPEACGGVHRAVEWNRNTISCQELGGRRRNTVDRGRHRIPEHFEADTVAADGNFRCALGCESTRDVKGERRRQAALEATALQHPNELALRE